MLSDKALVSFSYSPSVLVYILSGEIRPGSCNILSAGRSDRLRPAISCRLRGHGVAFDASTNLGHETLVRRLERAL